MEKKQEGKEKKKKKGILKKIHVETVAVSQGEGHEQLCNSPVPEGLCPMCRFLWLWQRFVCRGEGGSAPSGASTQLTARRHHTLPHLHLSHFHATAPELKQRSHQSSPERINLQIAENVALVAKYSAGILNWLARKATFVFVYLKDHGLETLSAF